MKVVGISQFGGPEVLRVYEIPDPHAGSGEIRVRVHAASVSPADTLIRSGAARAVLQGRPPYVPGLDAAGVVDEIGPESETDLTVGDRVMAMMNPTRPAGGAYAQWVVLPASYVVRAPAGSSHAEASTLSMSGLTARLALDELALFPGARLGVTGAAGVVGGYAVQLAKADGLTVIADASPDDEALVLSLGADAVMRRGPDIASRFSEIIPQGLDAIIDAALIGDSLLTAIRDGGAMALVRRPDEEGAAGTSASKRGVKLRSIYVHDYDGRYDKLNKLREQAERGELTMRVASTYPWTRRQRHTVCWKRAALAVDWSCNSDRPGDNRRPFASDELAPVVAGQDRRRSCCRRTLRRASTCVSVSNDIS